MSKQIIFEKLLSRNLLWSYQLSSTDSVPDELLIEKTLQYGDVDELKLLSRTFDRKTLKSVWLNKLVSDSRLRKTNFYLAKFFFGIKNPQLFSLLRKKICDC